MKRRVDIARPLGPLDLPRQRDALDRWLETERERYDHLLDAWPDSEPLPPDMPTTFREWWTLRHALERPNAAPVFGPTLRVEHLQDARSAPDFDLTLSDGTRRRLEITEATAPADKLESLRGCVTDGFYDLGAFGGRLPDGGFGDEPMSLAMDDLAMAVVKKASKAYARGAWLLIRPNSNVGSYALLTANDDAKCEQRLRARLGDHHFGKIIVIGRTRLLTV